MRGSLVGGFLFLALASCSAKGRPTGFDEPHPDAGGSVDSAAPGTVTIKNVTYVAGDGANMTYQAVFDHITLLLANDTDQDVQATSTLEIQAGSYRATATFKAGMFCSADEWFPKAHTSSLLKLVTEPGFSGHATLDAQCAGPNYPKLYDTFVFPDDTTPALMYAGPITVSITGLFKDGTSWTATAMGSKL